MIGVARKEAESRLLADSVLSRSNAISYAAVVQQWTRPSQPTLLALRLALIFVLMGSFLMRKNWRSDGWYR